MAKRDVSDGRKATYYVGGAMSLVGLLLFLSTFLSAAANFGNFSNFESRTRSMAVRAVAGMGLMIAGGALTAVGRRGLAGSGVLLDPQKAREDLEPWNRATGGMVKDALDEAGVDTARFGSGGAASETAMPFDEKLRRLHALHKDGLLNDEEYERERREVLDSN